MDLNKADITKAILDYMSQNEVTVESKGQDRFNQYVVANVHNLFTHLLSLNLVKPEMEPSFVRACENSYDKYVITKIIGL